MCWTLDNTSAPEAAAAGTGMTTGSSTAATTTRSMARLMPEASIGEVKDGVQGG
jgi:hypothetical protein